jgi:hypothetical protein
VLASRPTAALRTPADAKEWRQWSERERTAWLTAVTADPLLPESLLPTNYLGRAAWKRRTESAPAIARQLAEFSTRASTKL